MAYLDVVHLLWKEYQWNEENIYNNFTSEKDRGIYQVYGDHPIYGENTLLYIGQAKDQSYSQRLYSHHDLKSTIIHKFRRLHISYFLELDEINSVLIFPALQLESLPQK